MNLRGFFPKFLFSQFPTDLSHFLKKSIKEYFISCAVYINVYVYVYVQYIYIYIDR